mgnify:CR=1 FL=1|tara:strand:- start:7253 stop:7897 length:645 start_codon:yes stop_codon:yes gene_type:complete
MTTINNIFNNMDKEEKITLINGLINSLDGDMITILEESWEDTIMNDMRERCYEDMLEGNMWVCADTYEAVVEEKDEEIEDLKEEIVENEAEMKVLGDTIALRDATINSYQTKLIEDDEVMMCETLITDTENIIRSNIQKTDRINLIVKQYNTLLDSIRGVIDYITDHIEYQLNLCKDNKDFTLIDPNLKRTIFRIYEDFKNRHKFKLDTTEASY